MKSKSKSKSKWHEMNSGDGTMKTWQTVAISAVLLVGLAKVAGVIPGVSGTGSGLETSGNGVGVMGSSGAIGSSMMPGVSGSGVVVPGMNGGYSCDLGELGRSTVTNNKKEFWGDDDISQSFKRTSEQIEKSIQRSIRESGVSL